MIKIFVLCFIIVAVKARPSYLPPAVALPAYEHYSFEPTVIGHTITHLPTAVSHQSQTIVHEKRPYLRPIVDYQPAAAYVQAHYPPIAHTKLVTAAAPFAYAPLSYATKLYPTGWDTGLTYTKGWNGWPLK